MEGSPVDTPVQEGTETAANAEVAVATSSPVVESAEVSDAASDIEVTDITQTAAELTETPKPKPTKKAKKNNPTVASMTSIPKAISTASKEDIIVETGKIVVMPIHFIDTYDNPRHEPEKLYDQGYILFGDPAVEEYSDGNCVSLIHLALSTNMDHVRQYVDLIEQYEGPINKLINPEGKVVLTSTHYECVLRLKSIESRKGWKIEKSVTDTQSIVELAEDLLAFGQIDPIKIRNQDKKIVVLDGGRRLAAILYLHAKSRVCREDKVACELFGDGVPKEFPAVISALEVKNGADDYALACVINMSRKQFTPLQEGRIFHEMLDKINPDTGKKYSMVEAANKLGVEYGTFRNREALWRKPVIRDGVVVRGLTDAERNKVAQGLMTLTAASRKALGEAHYSKTGEPAANRQRALTLREIQNLFDLTPAKNVERLKTLAECMGLTLDAANKQSKERVETADAIALKKAEKPAKNKKRAKAS